MRAHVLLVLGVVAVTAGCNKRVFEKVESSCTSDIVSNVDVPTARAADILIVIDNSGSMAEEQIELARNFVNDACPIDLSDIDSMPERYKNPSPALYGPGGELAECGFIQLLAAFDNEFHVGVVTTDVSLSDDGPDDAWGDHPQRGCLQPDGPPAAVSGTAPHKFITRDDLNSSDSSVNNLAARFTATLDNIRTFGSPVERGLDAATLFLDAGAERADGCENDLTDFRRDDAQLVVLFLTDEQDCSHDLGNNEFGEELTTELDGGNALAGIPLGAVATRCYTEGTDLPGVSRYVDEIKAHDARAKVAVIAGMVTSTSTADGFKAEGCTIEDDQPEGGCWGSHGSSIFNSQTLLCGSAPTRAANGDELFDAAVEGRHCDVSADGANASNCELECCVADAGSRYLSFAREFKDGQGNPSYFLDSICKTSYRDTMIGLASFIASVDFVQLASRPKNEDLIIVEVTRDGADKPEQILRIDADDCIDNDGWYYDPAKVQLVFCGDARPRPGDNVDVRAAGTIDDAACVSAGG